MPVRCRAHFECRPLRKFPLHVVHDKISFLWCIGDMYTGTGRDTLYHSRLISSSRLTARADRAKYVYLPADAPCLIQHKSYASTVNTTRVPRTFGAVLIPQLENAHRIQHLTLQFRQSRQSCASANDCNCANLVVWHVAIPRLG